MPIPIIGGILGAALVGLVLWAIIDPQRFKQAGEALGPFGVGFGELITAPLQPIGALGTELTELSRGLGDFLDTVVKPIIDSIKSFAEWASTFAGGPPGKPFAQPKPGTMVPIIPSEVIPPTVITPYIPPIAPYIPPTEGGFVKDPEKGMCEGLKGQEYLDCVARALGLRGGYIPFGDWAKSQPFLESVLLKCGLKES